MRTRIAKASSTSGRSKATKLRLSRRHTARQMVTVAMCAALAALFGLMLLSERTHGSRFGQVTGPIVPDHRWAHFVQGPDGVMSNDAWSIVATGGAVWVGTDWGVARYDGAWTAFPGPETDNVSGGAAQAFPGGVVTALAVGTDGESVLAGTGAGKVARWDGQRWAELADVGSPVHAVLESDGAILAGAEDGIHTVAEGGLAEPALQGTRVNALLHAQGSVFAGTDDGLWRLNGARWERVELGRAGARSVFALSETGDDRLAAGTPDGVLVLDDRLRIARHLPVSDELGRPAMVQALELDASGTLWAGTDGAGAYEFAAGTYDSVPHGQAKDPNVTIRYVRDVAVDTDGSVWFATPTGVYRYQIGMWHLDVQGDSVGDAANHVNDLLVAEDGTLWIATGGGGVRAKPGDGGAEVVYAVDEGVPSTVLVLEEDAAGDIWAGTFYGLFRFSDGQWELPGFNSGLPSLTLTALLRDGPRLWIGTEGGLATLAPADGTLRPVDEFDGVDVEALALDGLQRVWVGTKERGAWVRESDGEWTRHEYDPDIVNGIPGNWVISGGLAADWRTPGNMWALISRQGLAYWDGSGWRLEDTDNQIPVNLIWMLETEPEPGRLWIGSEGGLTQYDGETWGTLTQDDGLQSASVYAIARAHDGGYWIGGPTGLTYYVPDQTQPWVRVDHMTGDARPLPEGDIRVPVGEELGVTFSAGDLQTLQDKLNVRQRITGAGFDGEWKQWVPGTLALALPDEGPYEIQVVARDQSYNYSELLRLPVVSFVPPATVDVPGLGPVEPGTFAALVILGVISFLGAGYVLIAVLQQRTRSVEALNRGFNPYISGEPVRSAEMFFGRRDLVQRIVDTLHNNSVMIHGERRIGKTTILFQLSSILREVDDSDYWFVPIYVDLEGTPQEDFFHFLIEEIDHAIARLPGATEDIVPHLRDLQYHTVHASAYDDRDFHRSLRQVIDVLDEYGAKHHSGKQLRLILLLDEMDVMSRYDSIVQQQLRRIFMREFAWTVGAVVAGIRISKDWDRIESPWYNLFNEIALEPFTDEDALALLIEPVAGYYRYDGDALEFILGQSQGRPYRVQQYGLEAVNHMLAGRRRKVLFVDALEAHERIVSSSEAADNGLDDDAHPVDEARPADGARPSDGVRPSDGARPVGGANIAGGADASDGAQPDGGSDPNGVEPRTNDRPEPDEAQPEDGVPHRDGDTAGRDPSTGRA